MEQGLLQDLAAESIKINGIDVFYIPRTPAVVDAVFNEVVSKEYDNAFLVDVYVKSVDGFDGEGQFLSKFNLEIRDSITFCIAPKTFEDEIGNIMQLNRPNEGDLIYFPQGQRLFQIKYVEKFAMFLPLGTIPFYDLKCEMFEYSDEVLNTGIEAIDAIAAQYSTSLNNEAILLESGMQITDEDGYTFMLESWDIDNTNPLSQNDEFDLSGRDFIDFSEADPFSEGLV
jgi:hypothetical protein